MKLWSVLGNSQMLDGGAMFGNVPRGMWEKWVAPDAANRIPLACRALLVEDLDGKTVLFETGIGAFFEPKLRERYGVVESRHVLLDSLRAAGFAHEDIDVVVLSHLHFDHAGGLLAPWQAGKPASLLFPNAKYIVGRRCWERATHPHPRDRASFITELQPLLQQSGRLELVDNEYSSTLGKSVRFSFSDGHTPGLMLAEIAPGPSRPSMASGALGLLPGDPSRPSMASGALGLLPVDPSRPSMASGALGLLPVDPSRPSMASGALGLLPVVFCADLIPGRPWVHLPVTMGYDRAPELLIDEKRAFLEDKLARGVRLFFTHDVDCAAARVTRDDKGRFGTADEQAELAGEVA